MKTAQLYWCPEDGWQGNRELCGTCGNQNQIKEVPKKRADLYFLKELDHPVPGVTAILKVLAKPQLIHWAAKTAASAALKDPGLSVEQATNSIYESRDKAGNKGHEVHKIIDNLYKGLKYDFATLPEAVKPHMQAYEKFLASFPHTVIASEKTIFSRQHQYAGTMDRIIQDSAKKVWLIDYKTSNGVYPDQGLQLRAYKEAAEEMKLVEKIDHMAIIHLKDDGTYSLIEMDEPFEVFLALKTVYEWNKS